MLTSRRGRANGAAYLVGFLAGQAIAFVVALLFGAAATPDRDGNEELAAALELAFGLLLLVIAVPQRRRGEAAASTSRMKSCSAACADSAPARRSRWECSSASAA